MTAGSPAAQRESAPAAPLRTDADDLPTALDRLAARARLQESMLYEFRCVEEIRRRVYRSKESAAGFGWLPEENLHLRHGILAVRGESGRPREARVKLGRKGAVKLDRRGKPVEIKLPPELAPLALAFPHAQVVWFTTKGQEYMEFRVVDDDLAVSRGHRIECAREGDLALEFLDREGGKTYGPPSELKCYAGVSGQMCLDPDTGDVQRIEYYQIRPAEEGCAWDFERPFAIVEQDVVEDRTGIRFPSRVTTWFAIDWRDTAFFEQTYRDCVFANVRIREVVTGVVVEP